MSLQFGCLPSYNESDDGPHFYFKIFISDMLQEKKDKETSRKQTLQAAEEYILSNVCSSATNIYSRSLIQPYNSFQAPYCAMPPLNYLPPPISSPANYIPLTSSLGSAPFNSLSHSVPITSSFGLAPFNSLSNSIPITSSLGSAPFNSLSDSIPITSSFSSAPFNSLSHSIPTAVSSAISLNNFSATPFSPISLDRSTFRLGSCDMPPSSFCSTPIPPLCLFPSDPSCTTAPYTSLLTDSHFSSLDTCSAYQVPSSTPLTCNSSSLQQNRNSKTSWTISKPVDSLTYSPHTDLSTTSSILSNSFSVLNTEIQVNDTSSFSCKSCLVHENQIQSLKTALSQAREDSCRLHQRIRELEAMQNNNGKAKEK